MTTFNKIEIWREVQDYPYEVSSFGRVRRSVGGPRCKAGRILKPCVGGRPPSSQYLYVSLSKDGVVKVCRINVLVARAFFGDSPLGHEVDHKDGDHFNNRDDNLEYVTHSENQKRAYQAGRLSHLRHCKISDEDVIELQRLFWDEGATRYDLAERFKIHPVYASKLAHQGRMH